VHPYRFLVDTYETERLKTLSVWSQFADADLAFRPAPRARTPLEHFVHQCASEDAWMKNMLGIDVGLAPLPARETRLEFLRQYARASELRLAALATEEPAWFEAVARFFGEKRSRAWILVRRFTHTSHHRGQLTTILRLLGRELASTYGPTADTGGLAANGAQVIYRYASVEDLLAAEAEGHRPAALPGPGPKPPTERPAR
jgi:uncharacterized damage-inducible protein DinB